MHTRLKDMPEVDNSPSRPLIVKSGPVESKRPSLQSTAVIVWLIAMFALAMWQWRLPEVPTVIPPERFSANRAEAHLAVLANQPHPVGSPELAKVRNYIVSELARLGLKPEIQSSQVVAGAQIINVQNIEAVIPGSEASPGILLVAHYDSVPNSPGAADDGSGVVTLLEAARAIRSGAILRNPVMLLFTDSEERALGGAQAFVAGVGATKKFGLLINLDARGNSGPAFMFESERDPGTLISEFGGAAPVPVANSLMPELYHRLNNETDFTVFRRAGLPGLDFALIDHLVSYHSALDSRSSLDTKSLQHMGDTVTALLRKFGNEPLPADRKDVAYFNLLRGILAVYPAYWSIPLALLATAVLAMAIRTGLRRRRLTAAGVALGLASSAFAFILGPGLAWLCWSAVLFTHKQFNLLPNSDSYQSTTYHLALAALAVSAVAALYAMLLKRSNMENLWTGTLIWFAVLSLATSILAPGASYLFSWPLLFLASGFVVLLRKNWDIRSAPAALVLAVCAAPGILLIVPGGRMLFWVFPLSFVAAPVFLVSVIVALLLPQLETIVRLQRWFLAPVAALLFVAALVVGLRSAKPTPNFPLPSNLIYVEQADSRSAYWVSRTGLDNWNRTIIGGSAQHQPCAALVLTMVGSCWIGSAVYNDAKAPTVEKVSDQPGDEGRTLRLRISSPRRASIVVIAFDPGAKILSASVNGEDLRIPAASALPSGLRIAFVAPHDAGEELTCIVQGSGPVPVTVVDQYYGLEGLPGFTSRPSDYIPGGRESDSLFVTRSFRL